MSLVGNLEDLSLPDILQIISLSKRSGILTIKRGSGIGTIVIRDGKIVQAFSPGNRENLGEILVREGLLSLHQLVESVEIQKREGMTRRLGAILVERRFVEPAVLKEVVKKQIEAAVFDLLTRNEGSFSFELREVSTKNDISVDPELFVLEKGLDTQWLVMEGTRRIDEKSQGEAQAEVGESPEEIEKAIDTSLEPALKEADREEGKVSTVYIIDDELLISDLIAAGLRSAGLNVETIDTCPEALRAIRKAIAEGVKVCVIVDLVMPTLDGSGFLGGVELIQELRQSDPSLPFIALAPYDDPAMKEYIADLPVAGLLVKPDREGADMDVVNKQLEQFVQKVAALVRDVEGGVGQGPAVATGAPPAPPAPEARPVSRAPSVPQAPQAAPPLAVEAHPQVSAPPPRVEATAPPPGPAERVRALREDRDEVLVDLRSQLMAELGEQRSQVEEAMSESFGGAARGLAFLKEMIEELHNPSATTEISLLILRFATELVNRSVLFLVKESEIKGLGGFGLEAEVLSKIRNVSIQRDEPCLLNEVVQKSRTYKGPLPNTPGDRIMVEELGGGWPDEVVVMPVISRDRAIVLLYGDNLPENSPIPAVDMLEIFISQAGMAMEKALLEKRLKEIEEGAR